MSPITKKEKVIRIFLIIASLIVATLIILSVSSMFKNSNKNPIKTFFQKIFSNNKENKEVNRSQDNTGSGSSGGGNSRGSGGGGSGSSSGSGSGNDQGSLIPGCILSQISYSLENFKENSSCTDYAGNVCIQKIINCSIEIHNGDQNYSGNFKMKVSFMDTESNNLIDSQTQDLFINANAFEVFGAEKTVDSTGENGQANKGIKCVYNTVQVPQKEICG